MKAINSFTLTMLSRSTNEAFARSAVAAFVTCLDPTLEEINDIKTAVSEAVTNCIVHGYRDTIGKISITVQIFPDNVVAVKVRDAGCGIEDIEKAKEPLFTTAGGERAGLGFAVIESFMDSLMVTSKVGKGTTVTMKKRLSVRVISHER